MAWNPPKTDWMTNQLVTAEQMNDIGTNLVSLHDRPVGFVKLDQSNITSTSTSYVDVHASLAVSILLDETSDVLVGFTGYVLPDGASSPRECYFDIAVNGTRRALDDGLLKITSEGFVSFTYLIHDLAASITAYNITLQWKARAGSSPSVTLYSGAGTANLDFHPIFWAKKI